MILMDRDLHVTLGTYLETSTVILQILPASDIVFSTFDS